MVLGKKIREERKKLELSQEKLAFKVGISVNFLGQIERGTKKPTLATAERISSALDTQLSELLREEEQKLPKEYDSEKIYPS